MDMDLDELDQAVSKLMDQPKGKRASKKPVFVPPRDEPVTPPKEDSNNFAVKVTTTPFAPPAPVSSPEHDSILPTPAHDARLTAPVSRPMPRVPERRRTHPGAMDIIQPVTKIAPPSATPARVGATLKPSGPVVPDPVVPRPTAPKPVIPAEPSPAEVSDEVLASLGLDTKPSPTITHQQADHEKWPDPLDFHDFDKSAEPPKPDPAPTMDIAKPDDAINVSPFVTTKVEKRPLGAYANTETPAPQPETPPKAELAEVAIQSNQHIEPHPNEEPEHDMNELRQMAIPPQYQQAANDKKDTIHNVYDTKEYHAAPQMMPTARKGSSPWLTISIVVLAVLVVAAVAVGYFMMTGTFDFTKLW